MCVSLLIGYKGHRKSILENIRQEIYAKIEVRVTVYRELLISILLFARS